ncbi:hypothetical protein ABW19_dt0205565 [Dactylella cylindrospora]|nr:hypothetical protein ABW19_dt0205565 [Dactylella cylindrospora]
MSRDAINKEVEDSQESTPPNENEGEEEPKREEPQEEPYSIFTPSQRIYIVCLTTIAAFFSPFSATTYLPALTPIRNDLGITTTEVNLSLTTYLISQAIAPSVTGELSDTLGRRPVYILTFIVYIAANIGLALQKSLAGLLVLRMVQSAGSSGTIAIGFGAVADITVSAERGTYMGFMSAFPLTAPALGPVIGGAISESAGWRWIFWFLAIFSGACVVLIILSFTETNRRVVGNGKIRPSAWNRPPLEKWVSPTSKANASDVSVKRKKRSWRDVVPNPLRSVVIIWNKDVAIILFVAGVYYAAWYAVTASIPQLFKEIYGYNELQIGLCYISMGTGGIISSILTGKLIDRDFRITGEREGIKVDRKKLEDMAKFPIEKARLKSIWWMMAVNVAGIIAYGWALNTRPVSCQVILWTLNRL